MTTVRHGDATDISDTVDLDVPADPAYLAVVRTATAGLATRLEFTLDEIEDLRIAVDEACSLLLGGGTHPGAALRLSFTMGGPVDGNIADSDTVDSDTIGPGTFDVVISGPAAVPPRESSFAWSVLHALVGGVETGSGAAGSWIRLTHVGGRGDQ